MTDNQIRCEMLKLYFPPTAGTGTSVVTIFEKIRRSASTLPADLVGLFLRDYLARFPKVGGERPRSNWRVLLANKTRMLLLVVVFGGIIRQIGHTLQSSAPRRHGFGGFNEPKSVTICYQSNCRIWRALLDQPGHLSLGLGCDMACKLGFFGKIVTLYRFESRTERMSRVNWMM